jgi:hypothetical protein
MLWANFLKILLNKHGLELMDIVSVVGQLTIMTLYGATKNSFGKTEGAKQEEARGKLIIQSVKKREDNPYSRIAKYYAGTVTAIHSDSTSTFLSFSAR